MLDRLQVRRSRLVRPKRLPLLFPAAILVAAVAGCALNSQGHREVSERLAEYERDGRAEFVLVTVPLLYEVGAERDFDCVVTVACSEQTQLARLTATGLSEEQARARIRAQWPMQRKMDRADFVIWNDGTLRTVSEQANNIWAIIKENCHAKR